LAGSASAGGGAAVFVSDPTAEAERVAQALRARGCSVVDVPQSMLVARVAVQRPRVVLLDADGAGALDVAARVREVPGTDEIHVLFLGRPGGAIASPDDARARGGSGLFVRPVEVAALVEKVEALVGARPASPSVPPAPPSVDPRSPRGGVVISTAGPSLPPASMRAGLSESAMSEAGSLRKLVGIAPPVSSELQQLLAEAEQRVSGASTQAAVESIAPSPEEEIEAVLPAELLASLDEALDEDDDEEDVAPPPRAPTAGGASRERTDGGGSRTTGASTTGSGKTPQAPSTQGAVGTVARETLPPPQGDTGSRTHAGTHREPSGSGDPTPAPAREDASESALLAFSPVLDVGDATRAVARAIALRTTASLCFAAEGIERRIVFREGDILTAASTGADETLLAFLGTRGELPRETVRRLASKFPPFGRHAGAALVARGYLRQDQMWPTLRAHAEWLLTRVLQMVGGLLALEPEPPGRLAAEPSVFGGSSGAEVFVDLVRRTVSSDEAVAELGGPGSRILTGPGATLLEEAALGPVELESMRAASGHTLRDTLAQAPEGDLATVVLALAHLGVFEVVGAPADVDDGDRGSAPDVAALDVEAARERVRARLQVVEDGDYFAVLGVAHDATGYEVRRAYLDLRRSFDPSRVLTAALAALAPDVRKITGVLDEAYEILKDPARRERYRRAIEATPEAQA
jgi:hypothetical protein